MLTKAISIAQQILNEFSISNPTDILIEAIAYERGVYVEEKAISGAEGRLFCRGNKGIVAVNSNIPEVGRKRFVVAHELGHFELHRKLEKFSICDEDAFVDWHRKRPHETEANEFAAELLMPSYLFRPACKSNAPSMKIVENLASDYKTSLTATAIRYVDIGWFPITLICSQNGIVKWFRSSQDFHYRVISIGSKIHKDSCAFDFYTKGTAPDEPQMILPRVWFNDYKLTDDQYFFEQCVALPRYNSVLSLIWECNV